MDLLQEARAWRLFEAGSTPSTSIGTKHLDEYEVCIRECRSSREHGQCNRWAAA